MNSDERRFYLTLVQILLGLPLLAGEYLYIVYHMEAQAVQLVLFSEIVFAIIWLSMSLRLGTATVANVRGGPRLNCLVEIVAGAVVTVAAGYFMVYRSVPEISDSILVFHHYSPVYFSAVFILITVFYAAWRLEQFWRAIKAERRWGYKYLVVGAYVVCCALAWSASYRLTYLTIFPRDLLLLALLLLFGWSLMSYAVIHHRLLNRKIFVSRKVVNSFVVPFILATYLLGFGLVSLIMRIFGLPLSFIMKWLFLALGFVGVVTFAISGKMRRKVHFFISTHFFINKYEYKDEWLALSQHLQEALTEANVVKALRQVLVESLYTTEIFIWLGDMSHGYRLVSSTENPDAGSNENGIASNDPLVQFILTHSHFYVKEKEPDPEWQKTLKIKKTFLTSLNLTLLAPISVGNQLAGLIGLGPEFTGELYSHDDFDLLTVLGTQTASALLAVRRAEELSHVREQQVWNRLSAFVLHDIKNAATMLSLLRENASEHIHEPEFQQDMLELVDDALKRMGRVERRLRTLKDEITPKQQNIELSQFLQVCYYRLKTKLLSIEINIDCKNKVQVNTDPELLFSILENLLLNAFEAGGEGSIVQIRTGMDDDGRHAVVEIVDNGKGIADELLPDVLFEPFKTTKSDGSGIGLWQVKRMVASLGGTVLAENRLKGGARFIVKLPLK